MTAATMTAETKADPAGTRVRLDGVGLTYPGSDRAAVSGVTIDVEPGEFLVLVGPSGCGKSTTLRMLAGLEFPTEGTILFDQTDVTQEPGADRDVAMVFQSYALYPHMTVAANMEFGLKNIGMPKAERAAKVARAAELLELTPYLDRKPGRLSGGQRQRVAMGRAIVRQPQVFLMDEPLSNLDAKLRVQTRTQIAELQRTLGVTTIYVTHDQTEAMTMGDRVVVMNEGRVEQVGTPRELYSRPASVFAASFIGSPAINLLTGPVVSDGSGGRALAIGGLTLPVPRALRVPGESLTVGFRAEDLRVPGQVSAGSPAEPADGSVRLTLVTTHIEALGSDTLVYGRVAGAGDDLTEGTSGADGTAGTAQVVAGLGKDREPVRGEAIDLEVPGRRVLFFDPATGRALA